MRDVIREIVIQVGDVEEAVAFYRDVCGFLHIRTVEHEGAQIAEMDADGQRVSLAQSPDPGVALVLRSKNARSERRRLQRINDYDGKPVKVEGGVWLPLTDPWGNQLGYWQEIEPPPDDDGAPQPPDRPED
jgi:catechol 2,3-dioxygenase-like lactoylglutathione lyase family enzyme